LLVGEQHTIARHPVIQRQLSRSGQAHAGTQAPVENGAAQQAIQALLAGIAGQQGVMQG